MRTSLRATIAIATALGVLLVAAVAGAGTPPSDLGSVREAGDGGGGGAAAMCLEGVPDCVDVIDPGTDPAGGGSVDGSDGQGSPPDRGVPGDLVDDPLCGVEIVEGEGPDGTVSIEPCPAEEPIPTEPEPHVVEPTPGMTNVSPHPFDVATVSDDGRTVTIDFWSGVEPCYVLDHVDVAYGDDTVTVTLFEGSDRTVGDDVACIDIALMKRVVIALDEPVGDRTIVDGAGVTEDPAA